MMKKVTGIIVASIVEEQIKYERQVLLWQDILEVMQHIINNPKYHEIGPSLRTVVLDIPNEGGAPSEQLLQQISDSLNPM